jgi:penicillin-binding protein 1A
MTEDDRTGYSSAATSDRVASVLTPIDRQQRRRRGIFGRRKRNRRIRWLRLLAIFVPLSFLALISTVFGMVLAFAPQIGPLFHQLQVKYKNSLNSVIYSAGPDQRVIGILTDKNQYFVKVGQIPPIMTNAIIAIEDKRFYSEPGIDYRGIARAFVQDVFHSGSGIQGGSTITEQFVKNALGAEAPGKRTIFEKLREAALAFQLTNLWSPQRILTEYLNTAYFGNGAYGVEAAARAYFGNDPNSTLFGCGKQPDYRNPASLCVTGLTADDAALLAGLVASPSTLGYDLIARPQVVEARRNTVLAEMWHQGYLTQQEYLADTPVSLPPAAYVQSPSEEDTNKSAGYFVQWVEQQLLANPQYGQAIYTAGYHIHTTLDYALQTAAQTAVDHILPPDTGGPAAALVAIDNNTGEVKAMVGGYDFGKNQFNLATTAERQPGSAFKVFDLAKALEDGYGPNFTVLSDPYHYNGGIFGEFTVHNDEHSYLGAKIPLWDALAISDNSVFARLGLQYVGTVPIAQLAHSFGITTTISRNPAMVIGGLHIGVTPLDMAHAYETIAEYGNLVSGSLASNACAGGGTAEYKWEEQYPAVTTGCPGPVGIQFVAQPGGQTLKNQKILQPTGFSASDAAKEISMMHGVVSFGTGMAAQIPGVISWGKTGTTSGYIDAWFVGSTHASGSVPSMTVAVWVGYPDGSKSMAKDFGGKPVYGGTYPALIWKAYVQAAMGVYKREAAGLSVSQTPSSGSATGTGAPANGATTTGAVATPGSTGAAGTGAAGTGATNPATGTVTNAGGVNAPAKTTPAGGTTTPTGGATTPTGGATTPGAGSATPPTGSAPSTGQGGGVTAPGG